MHRNHSRVDFKLQGG